MGKDDAGEDRLLGMRAAVWPPGGQTTSGRDAMRARSSFDRSSTSSSVSGFLPRCREGHSMQVEHVRGATGKV